MRCPFPVVAREADSELVVIDFAIVALGGDAVATNVRLLIRWVAAGLLTATFAFALLLPARTCEVLATQPPRCSATPFWKALFDGFAIIDLRWAVRLGVLGLGVASCVVAFAATRNPRSRVSTHTRA
jgi:hypothetical protein